MDILVPIYSLADSHQCDPVGIWLEHIHHPCYDDGIVCRLVVFSYSLDKFQTVRVLGKSVGLYNQDRILFSIGIHQDMGDSGSLGSFQFYIVHKSSEWHEDGS